MAEVIRMPKMSDTMQQGIISRWLKRVGDVIAVGDILAEVETDKATMELEAYEEGTLLYIGIAEKSAARINEIIAIVGEPGEDIGAFLTEPIEDVKPTILLTNAAVAPTPLPTSPTPVVKTESASTHSNLHTKPTDRLFASPLAKKSATEKGYDLAQIQGSGPEGRVLKKDVDRFTPPKQGTGRLPHTAYVESHQDMPVSTMRQTEANVLTASKQTIPHFYLTIRVNMNHVMALRPELNAYAATKVSVNDCIVKATALALAKHPKVNAAWLETGIRQYNHIHIGIAMAIPEGLVVPVVRFVNKKPLEAMSEEVKQLNEKAQQRKLTLADYAGATFTVTNLGMFGIESFSAIINPPAACILAIGAIQQVPIVQEGQLVPAHMMHLTLSCDHRVVDGAAGALFLATVKEHLEQPLRMLL